jgi:hypothetical protein
MRKLKEIERTAGLPGNIHSLEMDKPFELEIAQQK